MGSKHPNTKFLLYRFLFNFDQFLFLSCFKFMVKLINLDYILVRILLLNIINNKYFNHNSFN